MRSFLFFITLSLLLTGCERSKESQYYLLNPMPFNIHVKKTVPYQHLKIGIDLIKVPAYLEKPQLVIYNAKNKVYLEENHQWAESVDKNIERVIISNLSTLLPGAIIENSSWDPSYKPTYRLQIILSQFSMNNLRKCELRADYIIFSEEKMVKKRSVYYQRQASTTNPADLVQTMNINLNRLTEEIAHSLAPLSHPHLTI